jgi:Anti-sigma-K factor rskA
MDDVGAHLAGGDGPDLTAAELAELDRLLADPAVWAEAGVDLSDRVVDAVTAAARAESSAEGPADAPRPPATLVPRRRRSHRSWYSIVAVAAAVIVALGLAAALSSDHEHARLRFAVALRGTALAPGVSGHATLTRTSSGWEVYLDADGLPRRSGSGCYEAWLKNSAGVLVPIGTFNKANDVRLWAGAPPTAYPILTVTRQQVGDATSSGEVVLSGTARPAP